MTDQPQSIHFDPEGILPSDEAVAQFQDDLSKTNTLVISELTDDQFDVLRGTVGRILSADPRNRTAKVIGKVAGLALLMIWVAACIWVVAFIVANLPTR